MGESAYYVPGGEGTAAGAWVAMHDYKLRGIHISGKTNVYQNSGYPTKMYRGMALPYGKTEKGYGVGVTGNGWLDGSYEVRNGEVMVVRQPVYPKQWTTKKRYIAFVSNYEPYAKQADAQRRVLFPYAAPVEADKTTPLAETKARIDTTPPAIMPGYEKPEFTGLVVDTGKMVSGGEIVLRPDGDMSGRGTAAYEMRSMVGSMGLIAVAVACAIGVLLLGGLRR